MTSKFLFEEVDAAEAWSALERFAMRVAPDPTLPLILPCEFMFMVAHDEPYGRVYEYKHKASRRSLMLTPDLRLVEYTPPRDELDEQDLGTYALSRRRTRTILERLCLDECGPAIHPESYCPGCRELIADADPLRVGYPIEHVLSVDFDRGRRSGDCTRRPTG